MPLFRCDLSQAGTPFDHFWEHSVGSGHAPLALRGDWQLQLKQAHRDLGFRRVRFHGLLSGDMHMVTGASNGALQLSFFNADQVIDFLLDLGMDPWIELSFMPEALASGSETTFAYRANVTPPRDYGQWALLIERLARHWLDRYGVEEVGKWHFEVWNEPNRDQFWPAGKDAYFRLYRYTVEALKEVAPAARVGGPASSEGAWLEQFRAFCQQHDLPLDFVSTHGYPNDPLANSSKPVAQQLSEVPRHIMCQKAQTARQAAGECPLYFTEWNSSSSLGNSLHDQSYAAAFAVRTIMNVHGLVDGYSFWTFSDLFEEQTFNAAAFHGGFGLMTVHGIPKPVYRAFQILHDLGNCQLAVSGEHDTVEAWAVRDREQLTILITNYAQPQEALKGEQVRIVLENAPLASSATVERVDAEHANAYQAWVEMGRPPSLDEGQRQFLLMASDSTRLPLEFRQRDETVTADVSVPPQGVAAIRVKFVGEEARPPIAEESDPAIELDTQHGRAVAFADEEALLTHLQRIAFNYFNAHYNLGNGLVADRSGEDAPASVFAVGLALTAYPVAVKRGFISRDEALARTLATLRFLWQSSQGPVADATGYKGFYYHYLDMESGRRAGGSELSSIDAGSVLAGVECAAAYFDGETAGEREVRRLADALECRVDWRWMLADQLRLSHGWKPESGFLQGCWNGYSEALFLYLLGLGAEEHALPCESYEAWRESYSWRRAYGYEYLYAGPLFVHQFSHLWVDFRGIQDAYMRAHHSDYFENSRRATYVQQRYAIENSLDFEGYGDTFWGVTAVNGPGPMVQHVSGINRYFHDYVARGVPYGPDDGTVAPWVTFACLPFASEIVLPTVRNLITEYPDLVHDHGTVSAVNPTFVVEGGSRRGWVSKERYAIEQGPVVIMIENYRSGLIWKLMRRSQRLRRGLERAGFKGGWLEDE